MIGVFTGLDAKEIARDKERLEELLWLPLRRTEADKHYSPQHVLEKCSSYEWQCWVARCDEDIDCVFVTYISVYPTGLKVFNVYLVGGTNMVEWLATAWRTFKAYARHHGCAEIAGAGRQGWLRELKKVESGKFSTHLSWVVGVDDGQI